MQVIVNLPLGNPYWIVEILVSRLKEKFIRPSTRFWEDLLLDFIKVESDEPSSISSNFLSCNKLIEDLYYSSVKHIEHTLDKFKCKVIDITALGDGFIYNVESLYGKQPSRKALQSSDKA